MKEFNRPRVMLIGCGASGMCFLHALATRRERGDDDVLLPYVTCVERANEPGGCWRKVHPHESTLSHNLACWYDDVWSNVCKECFEFHDYTYQQHFQTEVPTYLPRHELMDYFHKRTLQADPHLLDAGNHELHEIRYGTVVTSVTFDHAKGLFSVGTAPLLPSADADHVYEATLVEEYDYCIWAAGLRGKPRIPRGILNMLKTGDSLAHQNQQQPPENIPFAGIILHSIHSSQLEDAVANKHVVLIGDSDSAVDLSLQAVKLGASKVDVLSRSGYGGCRFMGSWPHIQTSTPDGSTIWEPIVEVHIAVPTGVRKQGTALECSVVEWDPNEMAYMIDEEQETFLIESIDTVIFCTGYVPNTSFLSQDLQAHAEDLFSCFWSAPPNFKMRENPLTPDLGDVAPSDVLDFSGNLVPGFFRSVLISNPKMMYIMDINSEYPLLHLEAKAWFCLAVCTGDIKIPCKQAMEADSQNQMLEEMNIALLRWTMDSNYYNAMVNLGENHWSDDYDDPRTIQLNEEFMAYHVGRIARNFRESKYPVDFGTYGDLNDLGKKLVKLGFESVKNMHLLEPDCDHAPWKTFRDSDPARLCSIFTGQKAASLGKPWLKFTRKDRIGVEHSRARRKKNLSVKFQ